MGPILLTLITEFLEKRDKQITVKMKVCPQSSSVMSFRERHAILVRYTELSITPAVLNFSLHRTNRGREGCAAFTTSRKADSSFDLSTLWFVSAEGSWGKIYIKNWTCINYFMCLKFSHLPHLSTLQFWFCSGKGCSSCKQFQLRLDPHLHEYQMLDWQSSND